MKRAFYIAMLMLQELRRDKAAWISMLVTPVAITFILGLAFSGGKESKITVSVADKDKSYFSKHFVDVLREDESVKIKLVAEAKARESVRKNESEAAVVIPADFGESLEKGEKSKIEFVKLAGSTRAQAIFEMVTGIAVRLSSDSTAASMGKKLLEETQKTLNQAASKAPAPDQRTAVQETPQVKNVSWRRIYEKADKNWEPQPPVEVEFSALKASKERGKRSVAGGMTQTSIGFTILFVAFLLLEQANGIIQEREKGTLGRLLTTPTSRTSILAGKMIGLLVIGSIQASILILAGKYIFKVDWGSSIPGVLVLMGSYLVATTGLGIMISALARTLAQAQAVVPLVVISSSMLAGCFWPIEIVPPIMQTIAKAIPATWAVSGLVDLIVRYKGIEAVYQPSLILLGFGAVFLAVGVKMLRFE